VKRDIWWNAWPASHVGSSAEPGARDHLLRENIEAQEFLDRVQAHAQPGKDINGRMRSRPGGHAALADRWLTVPQSVAINAFIMSILYKATPTKCADPVDQTLD